MKTNPFKDFTIKKTLKLLSTDGLFEVCSYFDKGFAEAHAKLREEKTKNPLREAALAALTDTQEVEFKAYGLLRVGYFFYRQRKTVPHLIKYVTSKGCAIDQEMLKACESEAEQVIRLGMLYPEPVHEYFIISLHTQPSKRYWQRRNDYCDDKFATDEQTINALQNEVKKVFAAEGRGHACQLKRFEYDGKHYLFMDLQDSPTERREWDGDHVVERFAKPVMEVVFLLDEKSRTVDVMAEDVATQGAMHQACASVLFGKEIESRPKDNEIYDLETLLKLIANNEPIAVTYPDRYKVEKIFAKVLRVAKQNYPYWEITLNLRVAKKNVLDKDYTAEMHRALKTVAWGEDKGFWRLSDIKATHAELVAIYWDDFEKQRVSKTFTINSKGGSNLHHDPEDEEIRKFLRAADILKERMELPLPESSAEQSIETHEAEPVS